MKVFFAACLTTLLLSSSRVLAGNEEKISTDKTCYMHGEEVEARFIHSNPTDYDFVGLYSTTVSDSNGLDEAPVSFPLSVDEIYGRFTFGESTLRKSGNGAANWPLQGGSYKAIMVKKEGEEGRYSAFAESHHFIVQPFGQSCDGKTQPVAGLRGSY